MMPEEENRERGEKKEPDNGIEKTVKSVNKFLKKSMSLLKYYINPFNFFIFFSFFILFSSFKEAKGVKGAKGF